MKVKVDIEDGRMLKGFHADVTPLEMMIITLALSSAADNVYLHESDRAMAKKLAEGIQDAVRKVDVSDGQEASVSDSSK